VTKNDDFWGQGKRMDVVSMANQTSPIMYEWKLQILNELWTDSVKITLIDQT
jgi:hypothetical protein